MGEERDVHVYLLPSLAPPEALRDGLAIVIDVLRATTTIVHALVAGCSSIRPCVEIEEAQQIAGDMRVGHVLLCGERGGAPIPGFDLGNSPREYTAAMCRDRTVVLTTSNGTRALARAAEASRVLIAAFVNYSAVCEQLRRDPRPVHIICAGTDGEIALEDTLLAGAIVDFLSQQEEVALDDAARLAWDSFENHRTVLCGALELGRGGANLTRLGYHDDIRVAAQVDRFNLVPELRRDPLRIEVGAVGVVKSYWPR